MIDELEANSLNELDTILEAIPKLDYSGARACQTHRHPREFEDPRELKFAARRVLG